MSNNVIIPAGPVNGIYSGNLENQISNFKYQFKKPRAHFTTIQHRLSICDFWTRLRFKKIGEYAPPTNHRKPLR